MAWNLRDFGGKKIMYYGKRAHVRPLSALNRDEARDCPVVIFITYYQRISCKMRLIICLQSKFYNINCNKYESEVGLYIKSKIIEYRRRNVKSLRSF